MPEQVDIVYAAGYTDADGSISVTYKTAKNRYELCVQVCSCHPDVPEWFAKRFGGTVVGCEQGHYAYKVGSYYRWSIWGRKAQEFIKLIQPYMKEKRYQAEMSQMFIFKERGEKYSDADLYTNQRVREEIMSLNSPKGKK